MKKEDKNNSNSSESTEISCEDNSENDPTYNIHSNSSDDDIDEDDDIYDDYNNYEDEINEIINPPNGPAGGFFNKHYEEEHDRKQKFFLILNPQKKSVQNKIQKKKYDFYNKYTNLLIGYIDIDRNTARSDLVYFRQVSNTGIILRTLVSDYPLKRSIFETHVESRGSKLTRRLALVIYKLDKHNTL